MASAILTANRAGVDEAELIYEILGGRRELFGDLIAPHLAPLLHTVRATGSGPSDVPDIVQQAVLKAFTHLKQFRFEASFRTWLLRIGMNEARQWRRKSASSRLTELADPALPELAAADRKHSPLAEFLRNEQTNQVRAAVARLPEKYRMVVLLRDLEDLSIYEVAGRLGLTIPAVKTRHLRAREKLAKFLRPSGLQTRSLVRR